MLLRFVRFSPSLFLSLPLLSALNYLAIDN